MSPANPYVQAGDADRLWFVEHPKRRFRLRPIAEAERERLQAPEASHIVAEKITSCCRLRRPVRIFGEVPDADAVLKRLAREGMVVIPPPGGWA